MLLYIEYMAMTVARVIWLVAGNVFAFMAKCKQDPYERFEYENKAAQAFMLFRDGDSLLPPEVKQRLAFNIFGLIFVGILFTLPVVRTFLLR